MENIKKSSIKIAPIKCNECFFKMIRKYERDKLVIFEGRKFEKSIIYRTYKNDNKQPYVFEIQFYEYEKIVLIYNPTGYCTRRRENPLCDNGKK